MLIGLDLGQKSLGIAISYDNVIVLPKDTIFYDNGDFLFLVKKLKTLIDENKITTIVLGISFKIKTESDTTKMINFFYFVLKNNFKNQKIILENENYTTKQIKSLYQFYFPGKYLKKFRKAKDASSAVLILESYLLKTKKNI